MKLLLISANRELSPYPVFPIGLAYLATPLLSAGHELSVLDLCFAADPEAELAAALDGFAPEAVILSLRNIDNVTWPESRSYLAPVREIVACCRGRAVTVLGGSGFSLMPLELMEYLGPDYGVVGEGEELLPEFLERLKRGDAVAGMPGVLAKGERDFVPPRHLERIGSPDRALFANDKYRRQGGMANLQTKRGCPFTCVYCTYPNLEGRGMRVRPVAEIVAELEALVGGMGIDYVYFVDDIFNYPPEFAEELCKAVIASGLKFNWSAFINPGFVTERLLATMIAAGCDAIEFGTDSGSPEMLGNLGKSFGAQEIRSASRLCRELGADFAHYLLFGGPGETEATIDESVALMDEVEPTAVIAMTGIRIFPGTALYQRALDEGVLSPEAEMLKPQFYLSPALGGRLGPLVTERAVARRNWIAPGLEINMSPQMFEALRHFQVRGPLWKMIKRLGRSHVRPLNRN